MRTLGHLIVGAAVVGAAVCTRFAAGENAPAVLPPVSAAPEKPYGLGHPPFGQTPSLSCSATSCHGNGDIGRLGGEHSTWAPEVFPEGPSDPHARAYRVLFNADSVRMGKLLNLAAPPSQTALCLKCHAVDGVGDSGAVAEGVGCGACHGPAEKWVSVHYLNDWKGLTNQEKFDRYGFVPTKNLTARISNCVKCHVGADDREVNHDLIAAGHPRLAFEYTRFHYNPMYRKHWTERTPQPDFEVRAWTIGQAATLRAAVELLKTRADRAAKDDPHTPWPEFSGYSCYACHQTIGTGDIRRAVGKADRKPGSLSWELWSNAAADIAALETPDVFLGVPAASLPELAKLRKLMQATNPNPAEVKTQAAKVETELDGWLVSLQMAEDGSAGSRMSASTAGKIANALARNTVDGDDLRDHDWDFLSANYLGSAAMYHASGNDKWKPSILGLSQVLKFPVPAGQDIQRYDSPAGFGPAERERARDLFRALGDATTSTGAK